MTTLTLKTFPLRTGGYWTQPAKGLGTCGWSPFPWTITHGRTRQESRSNFIEQHSKHTKEYTIINHIDEV